MSEYVRKHALVKWLEHEYETCSDELTGFRAFDRVKRKIQSGVFDPKDDLDEIIRKNHSLAVKMKVRTLELEDEIQRLRAIEQAIRDFQPMKEQQAGYEALVAWLESTTPFVLDSEKEKSNHE